MVFSSHLFLFYFLPLVLLLNYVFPFRFLTLMLALMSYTFHGWANPKWVLLMLFSSYVDYFCGLALVKYSGLKASGDLPWLPKDQPRNAAQKTALLIRSGLSFLSTPHSCEEFNGHMLGSLVRVLDNKRLQRKPQ
jgi:alginate O-acetyltransferase complex protein AlgI